MSEERQRRSEAKAKEVLAEMAVADNPGWTAIDGRVNYRPLGRSTTGSEPHENKPDILYTYQPHGASKPWIRRIWQKQLYSKLCQLPSKVRLNWVDKLCATVWFARSMWLVNDLDFGLKTLGSASLFADP